MFLFALLVFHCATGNSTPGIPDVSQDICITGFTRPEAFSVVQSGYEQLQIAGAAEALLRAPIRQWFKSQNWQAGYSLWQESRRCRNAFGSEPSFACAQNEMPLPVEGECGGAQDGYEFLVMHRYLLQTIRALWPQLEDPFSGWRQFPRAEDYPPLLQSRFYAWPNGVLNKVPNIGGGGTTASGHGGDILPDENIVSSRREQLLARWKTEGELGQWLQCGTAQKGVALNSHYRALITNAMPVADAQGYTAIHPMDLYLFWKTHGWMDQVWEDYRRALGKTPEDPVLQAALIQQCRVHNFWVEKSRNLPTPTQNSADDALVFWKGELNPRNAGKIVRLMGEILEIRRGPNDKTFIKIDVRRVGVKPVWVSSFAPLAEELLSLGSTYEFVGNVASADALDASGQLHQFLASPALLLVKSLQSPK